MIYGTRLKTNGLCRPSSLTPGKLHFSWAAAGGKRQSAYQVKIYVKDKLEYDSGRVESGAYYHVPSYQPQGHLQVSWKLVLWDGDGVQGKETGSWFGTVPDPSEWKAEWIDPETERPWLEILPVPGQESNPNPAARICKVEHRRPASYLRKCFAINKEIVSNVWLYATAHGIYDIWLNGIHLDGWLLAPGTSQYKKRLMVQGYEVSRLLKEGENSIVVSLGDGWYRGSVGNDMDINTYGDDLAFLCQIMEGDTILLKTDETWECSSSGPLFLNDMMRGETYDAKKETLLVQNSPDLWYPAKSRDYGYSHLTGSDCPPILKKERYQPSIITTPAGETVLDFGQNFAGFVELHINAEGGEVIRMTHGETLDEKGNFTIANFQNFQKPECTQLVTYTCKQGENDYYPTKCYFGFRYVKIETELPVREENFTGIAIYSDMEETACFHCGNEEVNRLFRNTMMSMKSNFIGVPTDCPTREKSGFTGDAQVFCDTALYLMDSAPVFRSWLKDVAEGFLPDGGLRQIAPDNRAPGYFESSAGWCDAIDIIPWKIWKNQNIPDVAEEEYDAMKKWVDFSIERAKVTRPENENRIEKELLPYFADMGFHWGEWMEPGADAMQTTMDHMLHGEPEVATAYLAYSSRLLSEMADALGEAEDAEYYRHVSLMAQKAYRRAFLPEGKIDADRQCLYVRPLALGLLDEKEQIPAAQALAENIQKNGNHLNTGFLSTGELCRVLTDCGQVRTAYDLLLQPDCPGWLYPVRKGATTIWENWNGIAGDGTVRDSLNHYSYGAVCGWLIDRVCGIRVEFGKIRIQPYPDRRLGFADAGYCSPIGLVKSGWRYEKDELFITVEIPAGQQAEIILPDGTKEKKEGGKWEYVIRVL